MDNKEEFLKKLYANEAMLAAFNQVQSSKESNQIKACIDEVVGKFYDSITAAYAPIQKNPDIFKNMVTEEESSLIKNEESIKVTKDK
jgi:hypothetical protein